MSTAWFVLYTVAAVFSGFAIAREAYGAAACFMVAGGIASYFLGRLIR